MKITKISVYQVDLPLNKPYWLSRGRLQFEQLDSTIIAIETDADITAGERLSMGGRPIYMGTGLSATG